MLLKINNHLIFVISLNRCTFRVKDALNEIKNVHNINLPDSTDVLESCLMFNYIKRNYYLCDGKMRFTKHLTDFRNVLIEFFMEENEERRIDASVSEVSVKKRKSKKKEKDEGVTERRKSYLHLMAIVDLSDLLYPGGIKKEIDLFIIY